MFNENVVYQKKSTYNYIFTHMHTHKLLQSHQAFHTDLMELKEINTELKELVNSPKTLEQTSAQLKAMIDLQCDQNPNCHPVLPVVSTRQSWPHPVMIKSGQSPTENCRGMEALKLTKPDTATY